MKGPKSTIIPFFSLLTLLCLLQACGGSGDNTPVFTISADISEASFSTEAGKASEQTLAVNVTFDGEGLLVGYSPDADSTGWLNYRTETVSATSATIYIDVVTDFDSEIGTVFLPQGLYNSTLRLSTGTTADRNLAHHDIKVSLLVWQLMSFAETFGATETASQSISVASNGETLTASADVDWLTVDSQAGTENTEFTVNADLSAFTASGLYQGNIILTGSSGEMSFPVELGLDNRYLFADDNTLAFTSTPDINATEQTITINSNSLSSYDWQASSQAPWLTLTPIADSNQLTVSADPSLASANTTNNASITISSTEGEAMIAETVNVSFYNSDQSTADSDISNLSVNDSALVPSPLWPYIYVGVNNELRIYHQYSHELLTSVVISPSDSLLGRFVIHPNGSMLLARADENVTNENGELTTKIHRYNIDLSDISNISVTELSGTSLDAEPMRFVRFGGRYFIITQALELTDENLQQVYWQSDDIFAATAIEQAKQTGELFALDGFNATFNRYTAKVNDFTTTKISLNLTHSYRPTSLAENETLSDFVLSDTGSDLYLLSPTTQWLSFDGNEFTDQGLLEGSSNKTDRAITIGRDNQPHFARFVAGQGYVVDVYNNQQSLVTTTAIGDDFPGSIDITGDNKRLVINGLSPDNSSNIELINLPQFTTSASSLTFNGILGESIPSQTVTISGIGENWQVSEGAGLVLTQDNSGESAVLTVGIDHTIFTVADTYTATILLSDPDSNTSAEIAIELILSEN